MPEISVLIPVYNTGKTLSDCMRSVLAQTYLDFEVLLVDDDSPDGAGALCDTWAERDPRVRVLHLKNTAPGPSEARNAGLNAARGRYITMVDSDDTIERSLFTVLHRSAMATGAELTICNGCRKTPDGAITPLPEAERFTRDVLLSEQQFWDAFNTPWVSQFSGTAHRLYAKALFDGVRYPVGMLHEDYYVLPDLIARCNTISCLAYTGYYVLQHADSITATGKTELRLSVTKGDIHRAAYFTARGWFDRAEGALTDAAHFLIQHKAAFDKNRPGRAAEFEQTKAALTAAYTALAAAKGSVPLRVKAAALRLGLPVYGAWCRLLALRAKP